MLQVSKEQIEKLFDYKEFIPFLREFLKKNISVPDRSHFHIPVSKGTDGNLLTMPAWANDEYLGVKIVSVFPDNIQLPTINGIYILMSGESGKPLATFDGLSLTTKRTASVSGLASSFLSSESASKLLVLGTGNLCLEMIKAHDSVRTINQVWVWGRNYEKAKEKAKEIQINNGPVEAGRDLNSVVGLADIISTVTLSNDPLVNGNLLKNKVYLDLVGSFKKQSREADDDCLNNANIFVDTFHAINESGDLHIPIKSGIITKSDIISDLTSLCRNGLDSPLKHSKTYFKSVGFAAPDLAAAVYLYQKIN